MMLRPTLVAAARLAARLPEAITSGEVVDVPAGFENVPTGCVFEAHQPDPIVVAERRLNAIAVAQTDPPPA